MYLGKADVNTYDKGVEREFLVSNGTGNYGSSTVVGANTRSEHGLLVVRPQNSEQHAVLISKLEETLYANNKKYQLSTNRYKDLIYPDGYRYVQEYQGSPFPSVMFVVHSIFIKKSIFMPQNGTCTIVKYEVIATPDPINMDIRPLFAHRMADDTNVECEKPAFDAEASPENNIVSVKGRELISHVSFANEGKELQWSAKPLWFENLVYEKNGMPDKPVIDHLWSPGFGTLTLKQGDVFYVVLSQEPIAYSIEELKSLERETTERFSDFIDKAPIDTTQSIIQDLLQSACHLVADNKGTPPAILSGFPSVEQRARDTFIALPGLTLATGRPDAAKGILENWLNKAMACNGIVPAQINSEGQPELGDMDSNLWFLYAVGKYTKAVGSDFINAHYAQLKTILEKYMEGAESLGAVMDSGSKLLKYFNRENIKHWMSGDVSGEPLVDRKGYLSEINALWYNALRLMQEAASQADDGATADRYGALAAEVKDSFARVFWNEEKKYLFDWVDPTNGEYDNAIRPNAILSVSLPYPVLDDEKGRLVFKTCWNELYTTYGLRTLDPHHDKYKGRAEGRPDQKKKARLRGMAWPWLLGHFVSAYMRFNPDSKEMGWAFMRPFSSHLRRGCLGGVAEYFDGSMPYRPNGDVLSAISQGELLRVMYENLI